MSGRCAASGALRRGLVVLAAAAMLGGLSTTALAHHFLGLPHYKYGEDYPQIPYMEVLAQVGSNDLVFTHFPGFPIPGERVRFKLYIRNRATGEPFREPLPVEIVRKRFLRRGVPVAEPFEIRTGTGPEKNDYKFFMTFEEPEAFEVRVSFPGADEVEVIPFPVVIGQTDDRPLIFGAVLVLGLAVGTVATVKKRQRSRRVRAARSRP